MHNCVGQSQILSKHIRSFALHPGASICVYVCPSTSYGIARYQLGPIELLLMRFQKITSGKQQIWMKKIAF